ncbi:MAG: PEP-CTERM sorting domain-containing protein [Tepidisphaeraceae bacterium]
MPSHRTVTNLALISALSLSSAATWGATIADVKLAAQTSGNTSTIDSAVVTYVLPKGILVQDATGAEEIYWGSANNTGYTPAVGDVISATGNSAIFKGLYELESYASQGITLSITPSGATAPLPTPATFTTIGLTNGSPIGLAQQSQLGTLANVSFSATGTFAVGTYTVSDTAGSATVYLASGNALIGTAIPAGAVDVYGYLGQYDGAAATNTVSTNGYELNAVSITPAAATPEPAALGVLGLGSLAALRRRRR